MSERNREGPSPRREKDATGFLHLHLRNKGGLWQMGQIGTLPYPPEKWHHPRCPQRKGLAHKGLLSAETRATCFPELARGAVDFLRST